MTYIYQSHAMTSFSVVTIQFLLNMNSVIYDFAVNCTLIPSTTAQPTGTPHHHQRLIDV